MGFLSRHHSGERPQLVFRRNRLVFLELLQGSSQVMTGTSGISSWGLREVQSPRDSRGAPRDSSAVTAGAKGLIRI